MTVKLSISKSSPRIVNAGAPQGSVLGTYVFNIATDDLEDNFTYTDHEPTPNTDLTFLETAAEETFAHSTPQHQSVTLAPDSSPIPPSGQNFVLKPNTVNVPNKLKKRIEPTWRDKPIAVCKFVDDNLQVEKLDMMSQQTYQDEQTFKNPCVNKRECIFRHISERATRKGLMVNSKKTNLLVMSASRSYQAKAHFYDQNGQRIDSTDSLKTLGFIFNEKADLSTQVEKIPAKSLVHQKA